MMLQTRGYYWPAPTITPNVPGSNLLLNSDFTVWTTDNPDNWTVTGEVTTDPMVTEVAGKARIYTSGASINIKQAVLTAGTWYQNALDTTARVSGQLQYCDNSQNAIYSIPVSVQTNLWMARAVDTTWLIKRLGATNITIDNAQCTAVTLSTMLSSLYPTGRVGTWACTPIVAVGGHVGLWINWDGKTDGTQNCVEVLVDRQSTGTCSIRVSKYVNGTLTNNLGIQTGVLYNDRRPLVITRVGNAVAITYNGVAITGSPFTISDATIVKQGGFCALSSFATPNINQTGTLSWSP